MPELLTNLYSTNLFHRIFHETSSAFQLTKSELGHLEDLLAQGLVELEENEFVPGPTQLVHLTEMGMTVGRSMWPLYQEGA